MSTFANNNNTILLNNLLRVYEKVMVLKLFVDSADNNLRNMYFSENDASIMSDLINYPEILDPEFMLEMITEAKNGANYAFFSPISGEPINGISLNELLYRFIKNKDYM